MPGLPGYPQFNKHDEAMLFRLLMTPGRNVRKQAGYFDQQAGELNAMRVLCSLHLDRQVQLPGPLTWASRGSV